MTTIKDFIKNLGKGGSKWQLTLCILFSILASYYLASHTNNTRKGKEYVQLNKSQLATINKYISNYPDSTDSIIKNTRAERNALILLYIDNEYENKVDSTQRERVKALLQQTSSKDCYDYITKLHILVKSPFWLTGSDVYLEVWLWSLMGVLVSLIYYVSIANSKKSTSAGNDDAGGSFDPNEVPGQIAKMFYAPACTIVLVLGYHYISDNKDNTVDLSVNKGLIVFSFIAGFFSGRVMKFLDRLKDLLLPVTSDANTNNTTNNNTATGSLAVTLKLAAPLAQSVEGPEIIEAGFNAAQVTLTPANGGEIISLSNPPDDQADDFSLNNLATGSYKLAATMAHKKADGTIMNITAAKDVQIKEGDNEQVLELNIAEEAG